MEAVDAALSPVASTETGTSAATFNWSFENSAVCQTGGTVTMLAGIESR